MILREAFDYRFSRLDPTGDHIDPPSVAIYETLVAKDAAGRPQPALACGWEVSSDGLEWIVRLRPGARFHSGDRCDAEAALAALEHLRFHSFPDRQLWYWDPVDTVTVVDDDTLRFPAAAPVRPAPLPAVGNAQRRLQRTPQQGRPGRVRAHVRRRNGSLPTRLLVAGTRRGRALGSLARATAGRRTD